MNKAEFIEAVAGASELSRADAGRAVDAVISTITKALKSGDTITLVGFGTFDVRKRAAGMRRNPQTGESFKSPASKRPAFKAGASLKSLVNGGAAKSASKSTAKKGAAKKGGAKKAAAKRGR